MTAEINKNVHRFIGKAVRMKKMMCKNVSRMLGIEYRVTCGDLMLLSRALRDIMKLTQRQKSAES